MNPHLSVLGYKPHERPSFEEIKARWKELCRKHHPDKGGSAEEFRKVTHAYKMLTDPEYKQQELIRDMKNGNYNARGDLDIRIQVPIAFEDAFFGRKVTISYNQIEFDKNFNPLLKEHQDVVSVTVDLPAGCMKGHQHLLQGKGHKCGDIAGDVAIVFMPKRHPRFEIQEADVVATEQIPLNYLIKGGKLDVPTMWGLQTIKIKPGTKPGDKITIKRHGVLKAGDHVVIVDPIFPEASELKGSEWRGLEINWDVVEEPDQEAEDLIRVFTTLGVDALNEMLRRKNGGS